jgi:hypothetical protein
MLGFGFGVNLWLRGIGIWFRFSVWNFNFGCEALELGRCWVQNIIRIKGLGIKMSKAIWSQDSKAMSNINGNHDSRIEMSTVETKQKKLESYICSNHNASNPSPIVVLVYMKPHFSPKPIF